MLNACNGWLLKNGFTRPIHLSDGLVPAPRLGTPENRPSTMRDSCGRDSFPRTTSVIWFAE